MNKQLAKLLFRESDELFRRKKYAAALDLLDRLDAAFPDARLILYARAMCLAEVGRTDEGIALCDRLISRHKYKRAANLKSRMENRERVLPVWNAGGGAGRAVSELEHMNIGVGPSAFTVVRQQSDPVWRSRSAQLIAGLVLVVAIAAGIGYFLYTR